MEEIKLNYRPVLTKHYESLTVLVVAHSDSMQQKHPSGMTKSEMAEMAMSTFFEKMKHKHICWAIE